MQAAITNDTNIITETHAFDKINRKRGLCLCAILTGVCH